MTFINFCLLAAILFGIYVILRPLLAFLVITAVYRYKTWQRWGNRWVESCSFGQKHLFFPFHQEAVDWLESNGFKRSIIGGYEVSDEKWKFVYKGLRDEVGCLMSVIVRL